jgi:hypothetical protein
LAAAVEASGITCRMVEMVAADLAVLLSLKFL